MVSLLEDNVFEILSHLHNDPITFFFVSSLNRNIYQKMKVQRSALKNKLGNIATELYKKYERYISGKNRSYFNYEKLSTIEKYTFIIYYGRRVKIAPDLHNYNKYLYAIYKCRSCDWNELCIKHLDDDEYIKSKDLLYDIQYVRLYAYFGHEDGYVFCIHSMIKNHRYDEVFEIINDYFNLSVHCGVVEYIMEKDNKIAHLFYRRFKNRLFHNGTWSDEYPKPVHIKWKLKINPSLSMIKILHDDGLKNVISSDIKKYIYRGYLDSIEYIIDNNLIEINLDLLTKLMSHSNDISPLHNDNKSFMIKRAHLIYKVSNML